MLLRRKLPQNNKLKHKRGMGLKSYASFFVCKNYSVSVVFLYGDTSKKGLVESFI